jgi:LAO/AO transport system kinase
VVAICAARMRRDLEARLAEDPSFAGMLDDVVARRLDPASAATRILASFEA